MPEPTNVPVAEKTTEPALPSASIDALVAQLGQLNAHLSRKTSLKFLFAAALLQGLGYLLGATLVASILVAISVRLLSTLNIPGMMTDVLQSVGLPSAGQQVEFRQYPF